METLRNSRYFVLALLVFVSLLLVLMGVSALRTVASISADQTGTAEVTGSGTAGTAVAELTTPTATLRQATETLTPTPPLEPTASQPAYPGPGFPGTTATSPGSGYPPPVVPTSGTAGYPPPQTFITITPSAGYPGPTTAATQAAVTATASPSPAVSLTLGPTATLTPTPTEGPSPTPSPFPSATQQLFLPCNLGEFVQHVTYPPNSPVYPNETFLKTWQVRNGGTCTWNSSYDLIFDRGDQMDAKQRIALTTTLPPNGFGNLSIGFLAPIESGTARGYWLLRSGDGEEFGMGVSRDQPLEVRVQVRQPDPALDYDMANAACTATWLGRSGVLPCQGVETSSSGSIILLESPVLEGERHEDQTTLWTRPGTLTGASISGYYPEYLVRAGDHFLADIGCLEDSELCDLLFSVGYLDEAGREHTLESFEEDYDGDITRIDIDLTSLVGQEIRLVLRTRSFGQQTQGNGFWLAPAVINMP